MRGDPTMSAFADFPRPPEWTEQALCAQVDPELWWPDKGGSSRDAKRVCGRCPVRDQCLQAALERGEPYGVFGGLTFTERKAIRRTAA